MEEILLNQKPFDIEKEDVIFRRIFGLIYSTFGDSAFSRYNVRGEPTGRLAPAYFEAVVGAVTESFAEVSQIAPELLRERLKAAFASEAFINSTGPGANSIPKFKSRIAAVRQHLLALPHGSN